MKNRCEVQSTLVLAAALLLAWAQTAAGQTFSSGSTGADGAFLSASGSTVIPARSGGVYNYTTFNVQAGHAVFFAKATDNSPIVLLATGDVTISGTLAIDGANGTGDSNTGVPQGGQGGAGGFKGGNAGYSTTSPPVSIAPTAGQGPGGGAAATATGGAASGNYGAPTSFVLLTPLFGGSGGGGGQAPSGLSGGGGGGAILIASSTRITINGILRANGGLGQTNQFQNCQHQGASGSGGAIRLVAPTIQGTGLVQAVRGFLPTFCGQLQASDGRIRIEAFTLSGFSGTTNPVASVANAPGAVSPAGNPALTNVPTLQFATIGGTAVPAVPAASYSTPDVALAPGTANPVPVVLNVTNTPVGSPTVITVRLIPQGAASSATVLSTDHTGTFASSSATANVTLPVGQVTVLQAHAAMTLTGQTASLFPLIDGEPVERVEVAATPGQPSTLSLVTKSGKERRLDEMRVEDQMRVAQAWEAMKNSRTE